MSDNIKECLQIVRYAKGHYGTSDDPMRDLRSIISHITGCTNLSDINDRVILFWVHETWNLWARPVDKKRFLENLFYNHHIHWFTDKKSVDVKDAVRVMMSDMVCLGHVDCGLDNWDELPEKYPVSFMLIDNGVHPVGHT
jgi:hypothetical protein